MALIIEDGTGRSDAESYISVSDVTAYLSNHSSSVTAWSAATLATQERCIRQAVRYVESRYGARFIGTKRLSTQRLSWPRSNATDPSGYLLSESTIPDSVKYAVAELALRALSTDIQADVSSPGTIRSTRKKLDTLEVETVFASAGSQTPAYTVVDDLLRGWTHLFTELERG